MSAQIDEEGLSQAPLPGCRQALASVMAVVKDRYVDEIWRCRDILQYRRNEAAKTNWRARMDWGARS